MDTESSTTKEISLVSMFTSFTPITEYPLPFSDGIEEFIKHHPQFDAEEDSDLHVDELHWQYVNEISRNDQWSVFTVELYGYDGVYMWNHQLGEGLKIPLSEWNFGTFAEALCLARNNDGAWDQDSDPARPTDGCPYCDIEADENEELMTSSLRASGSYDQRCKNCGRSRNVG